MSKICEIAEEAIWDSARSGRDLPRNIAQHAEQCESCARFLEEAQPAVKLLQGIGQVDEVPDMLPITERITPRRIRLFPRLTYGFAAAVILGIMLIMIAANFSKNPGEKPYVKNPVPKAPLKIIRKDLKPEPTVVVHNATPLENRKPDPAPHRNNISNHSKQVHRRYARHRKIEKQKATVVLNESDTSSPKKEPAHAVVAKANERKFTAVSVTWSVMEEPDASYQYYQKDLGTGTVTEGSVSKSGNSIQIHLESKPEDINLLRKGLIENDKSLSI